MVDLVVLDLGDRDSVDLGTGLEGSAMDLEWDMVLVMDLVLDPDMDRGSDRDFMVMVRWDLADLDLDLVVDLEWDLRPTGRDLAGFMVP